jgi:hypothetical protein
MSDLERRNVERTRLHLQSSEDERSSNIESKKKHRGTKARVQAYKRRLSYIGAAITVAILVVIVISGFIVYSFLKSSPYQASSQTFQLKAAIVDHLSLTAPNQTFVQTATNTLEKAGYTVDYYPGKEVTVEFYRNLPTHNYDLIILRVHSAPGDKTSSVWLFTSEPYSKTKYVYEQLTDRVSRATPQMPWTELLSGNYPCYFAVGPEFVKNSMNGRFENTTVILMGCNGLTYQSLGDAFITKGAKVYVSWSGPVSASHTDQATALLLKQLITQKQTIRKAITETTKAVGRDPAYNSLLLALPKEAWDCTILEDQKTKS